MSTLETVITVAAVYVLVFIAHRASAQPAPKQVEG